MTRRAYNAQLAAAETAEAEAEALERHRNAGQAPKAEALLAEVRNVRTSTGPVQSRGSMGRIERR